MTRAHTAILYGAILYLLASLAYVSVLLARYHDQACAQERFERRDGVVTVGTILRARAALRMLAILGVRKRLRWSAGR